MGLKYQSVVLFALLNIFNFAFLECKHIGHAHSSHIANPLLDHPDIKISILNSILQNQGSSLRELHEIIEAANGNVHEAVNGINAAVKEDVLQVDGDTVKANPDGVANIFKHSVQAALQDKYSKNPELASLIQDSVNKRLHSESSHLNAAVEESAVPLDVAQKALAVSRKRRSLEPREFDLGSIVASVVQSILGDQIMAILSGLLETLKTTLNGLLITVAPGDPIGDMLAGVVNFAVKQLLSIITIIQESLGSILTPAPQSIQIQNRDLADPGTETNTDGLLDTILRPILSIVAIITSPVNLLLVSLVQGLGALLQPILGTILISGISNVLIALIDLLVPALPV